MAIFTRKKDSASVQVQSAKAALAEVNTKIADRRLRREAALLGAGDDFAEVNALDAELAELERTAVLWTDKIALLDQQARKEDAEATARRREGHIARIEAKLSEADQVAETELTAAVAALDAVVSQGRKAARGSRRRLAVPDASHRCRRTDGPRRARRAVP